MSVVQIEVTTKCNLACFYCAGRKMPQQDMSLDILSAVLDQLNGRHSIQLQGEGEPLMHPKFWEMVEIVRARGHRVGTLTNGTIPADISKLDWLNVSVDTLDVEQNAQTGRTHFDKTMANLRGWIAADRNKVKIKSVGYGQDMTSLRDFCTEHGIHAIVQPLSPKNEYASLYPVNPLPAPSSGAHCSLAFSDFKYFNVRGERLPCCFMKFPRHSYDEIMATFAQNRVPADCVGCRMLQPKQSVKLIATDRV